MNHFEELVIKARELFDAQKYKEATKNYYMALDFVLNDEDRAMVWAELCWTHYKAKSFPEVIEAAENVLSFNPKYKGEDDLYRLMGFSYFALENDEKAEEYFLKSLAMDDQSDKQKFVCYELGKLYFRNQRYADAEKHLEMCEPYFKENAREYWISLLFFMGFSQYYLQKITKAEEYFKLLIENTEDEVQQANGFYGLAYVNFEKKDYLETINICERISALNPAFFDLESVAFLTAASFFYLGRYDVFNEYFEQMKKRFSNGRYMNELTALQERIVAQSSGSKN